MQLALPFPEPKHVVALSGGKDSVAMALRLAEIAPREYEYIGNWTGNELPEFRAHLRHVEGLLGKAITPVRYRTDLYGVIDEAKMLPNHRARFCTRMLKIEPTIAYMEALPAGSVLYSGLRADEEVREGFYGEDLKVVYPMREWGWKLEDVWAYLDSNGICIPKRTDCAVCPYQRIPEWFALWKEHPEEFARGEAVEAKYGHTFRSAKRDTWPAALADMRREFEQGRKPRPYVKKGERERGGACRHCSM